MYCAWFGTTLLVGILYSVIGIVFALPSNQVGVWRPAAWAASAVVFAAHIAYEKFKLSNSSGATAFHVAVAVGIGGLGLAVAATVHSLFVPPSYPRSRFLLALVLWPLITALPAFLVALIVTTLLAHLPTRRLD